MAVAQIYIYNAHGNKHNEICDKGFEYIWRQDKRKWNKPVFI